MEDYFYSVSKDYYQGILSPDFHPEVAYQYGATPEFKERARPHCERFKNYPTEHKPITECPPVFDSKWRFFWFIGERDKNLDEGMMMYDNVEPKGFPKWKNIMDSWGNHMLQGCEIASEMAAIGLDLPSNTFTEKMKYAGHLLAPTGSDLNKFEIKDIFAGVHYGKLLCYILC
jgi:isopenicillin N synthase-like dioxygenase